MLFFKKRSFSLYKASDPSGNVILLVILFILICLFPGCSVKGLLLSPFKFIFFIIKLAGIPFIIYLVIRMMLVKWSSHFMKKKSAGVTDEAITDNKELINSSTEINFREFSETEDISISKEQGINLLHALNTGQQTWVIFKKSVGFFLIGTVIIFFLSKPLFGEFKFASPIFMLLSALIMYLFVKLRVKATRRISLKLSIMNYSILSLLYSYDVFVFLDMREDANGILWLFMILPVSLVVYLVYGFSKIKKQLSQTNNQQLLILRVFGSDQNTAFLFREISRTWRFLGSFVTIADPSYIRYQYSISSRENRRVFFNLFLLYFFLLIPSFALVDYYLIGYFPTWFIIFWVNLSTLQVIFIIGLLIMLLVLPVFLISISRITVKRFIRSIPLLNKKIDSIRTNIRSISATYKNFTLYCFDNVWKKAVQQILPVSKAVLMDLRGFTPGRRGCKYEIGLLIDSYPINKIVFLADEGPSIEAIKEIVKEQWKMMSAGSPNKNIHNPELKIYFVREEDKADINRIIALLTMGLEDTGNLSPIDQNTTDKNSFVNSLKMAIGRLATGISLTSDSMVIKKQHTYIKKAMNRVGFFEKWDLKLARPSVAKIFIPLLGIFLFVSFVLEIMPFFKAFSKYKNPGKIEAVQMKRSTIYPAAVPDSVMINITITDTSNHNLTMGSDKYKTALSWQLEIMGGKPGRAFRYDNAKIISEAENGRSLANYDKRDLNLDDKFPMGTKANSGLVLAATTITNENVKGKIIIDNQTLFHSGVEPIKRIKGTMDLYFILPEQKLIVQRPDSLLSKEGLLEIIVDDSLTSKRFWIERTNDGVVTFFIRSEMDEYEIHVFNTKGEINLQLQNNNTLWTTSYSDLNNSWIEIIPKKMFRKESWSFEKQFLPVH